MSKRQPNQCERCGAKDTSLIGSWFNTEMICGDCRQREEKHPHSNIAKMVERAHCLKGNMNFAGIGLSPDNYLIELKGAGDRWFHGLAATADYLHDIGAGVELRCLAIGESVEFVLDSIPARATRCW